MRREFFQHILLRVALRNNDVKSLNLRFGRQREHTNVIFPFTIFTLKLLVPILFYDTSPTLYDVNQME